MVVAPTTLNTLVTPPLSVLRFVLFLSFFCMRSRGQRLMGNADIAMVAGTDIWEDAYQDQPVGESRVHHGEWKIEEDGTLHLEGELYTKSTHMGGAQEKKVEEHKSLVFESLSNGDLKFVAVKSTFTPFSDGVVLKQSEVITASSPAVGTMPSSSTLVKQWSSSTRTAADEAAKQRRSEIAVLASPEGKRLAQEKKGVVRSLSLEKVKRKRADSLGGDKSLSLTNSQTS